MGQPPCQGGYHFVSGRSSDFPALTSGLPRIHFNPSDTQRLAGFFRINVNWIERLSDLLQIRERGISLIVSYMEIPLTKECSESGNPEGFQKLKSTIHVTPFNFVKNHFFTLLKRSTQVLMNAAGLQRRAPSRTCTGFPFHPALPDT